jgi:hypothetical protein
MILFSTDIDKNQRSQSNTNTHITHTHTHTHTQTTTTNNRVNRNPVRYHRSKLPSHTDTVPRAAF